MDPPEVGAVAEDRERDAIAERRPAGWVLWVGSELRRTVPSRRIAGTRLESQ